MKLRKIINAMLCFVLIITTSACTPKTDENRTDSNFVGIAIYQNSPENIKWNNIKQDPSLINNIIETKDDKILYKEEPEFLFYVYTQNIINLNTNDNNYLSNTTRNPTTITDAIIKFNLERIAENTDVMIYFIYKINNEYYLKFVRAEDNISNEITSIIIDIDHKYFNKVEILLELNLSTKKEY